MHRIDNGSAASAKPTPKPAGPEGFFTIGNVAVGQQATIVEADWLNSVQEELVYIVLRGGLSLDKTNNMQVLVALANLFTGAMINITVTQNILVPVWATRVFCRLVSGGGGGAHSQANNGEYLSGAGGGSGAYLEAQRDVIPGTLLNAIVGVAGVSETPGGTSSLASVEADWAVSCTGGEPGVWTIPTNSAGGIGGMAHDGDLNAGGSFGGDGQAAGGGSVAIGTGYGGNGPWGGQVRAGVPLNAGETSTPGRGPGAGGSGTYDPQNRNLYFPGGTGAAGLISYRFMP